MIELALSVERVCSAQSSIVMSIRTIRSLYCEVAMINIEGTVVCCEVFKSISHPAPESSH